MLIHYITSLTMHKLINFRSLTTHKYTLQNTVVCSTVQCNRITTTPYKQQYKLHDTSKQYLQNQHNTKEWIVESPYTYEIIARIPVLTNTQITDKIALSHKAYNEWSHSSLQDRVQLLQRFCDQIKLKQYDIAQSITIQMGKPITQALSEINGLVSRTDALIDIALNTDVLQTDHVDTDSRKNNLTKYITKEPIGVCCIFAPWNYPLLTIFNSVATALLCGNTILMKHSDRTPLIADLIEQLFIDSGAVKGLVQTVHINYNQVEHLIKHPQIKYVHFTGSVAGGRAVYSTVAKHRFIDVGLELGGKDAAYVTDNVDVKYAAENLVDGSCYNSGQSCCAVERIYVHTSQYEQFIEHTLHTLKQYKLGNPLDKGTTMGPIAQPNQPLLIQQQIDASVAQGAKILYGGTITTDSNNHGRFYQPTLITDVNHTMPIMTEETFGPVVAVQKVNSDNEAIQLINDSVYGLTGSIWCTDIERTDAIAKQLDVGTVFQNRCDYLDPYLTWSGRRDSGKGYGLSYYGFLPFLRTKSYNMRTKI